LQGEIEHKSQEIVNLLLSVSSKNEALINIKEELQSIRANLKGDPTNRKSLTALQEQIDTALQSEKILDRIEKEFDLVHNDFTKKLRADYPDLSANEIKICSYIKMNLSTKEIAPLMNMSLRGVETIRYRMRKKFALDRSDSLTEFIRNF
jgi:DNA-binding CsgD family transcriptional regulator